MPVTSGQYALEIAYEGQIRSTQNYTFTKGSLEEVTNFSATDYLPYGRFVVRSTDPEATVGDIELPSTTGQTLIGVTVWSDTDEKLADGTSGYPPKTAAAYLYKGPIAMIAETAMTSGGAIYARHTANGALDQRGRVRADADGGNADLVPATEAKVLFDCAAGEICTIELDISPIK